MKSKPTYLELEKENEILRNKIKEVLKTSEANYQDIFQTMTIGIAYTTLQGKVLATNKALENMLNIPNNKIVGKNLVNLTKNLLTVKTIKTILPKILDIIKGKSIKPFEFEYKDKILEIYSNYNRKTKRITGVVRDITDQKRAEEKFKIIFESAPDAYYLNDLKGRIIDGNKAAERLMRYRKEELIGKNFLRLNILIKSQLPKAAAFLAKNALGKSTKPEEFTLIRKGGDMVDVEIATHPVKIEGKTMVLGIARNITARKKAELALRENEEKLRNIFENSTNLFYAHTSQHVLTYMSSQVENLLGYTSQEVMIKWTELASDNPINDIGFQHTQRAIDTGIAQAPFELELLHKNGKKVWVEVREGPVIENGQTVSIVGALINITDRKKAEQALKDNESYKNALFHRSYTPMVVMDMKTYKFVDCNEAAIQILGFKRKEEVLGKTSVDVSTQKQYNGMPSSTAAKNNIKTAIKKGSVLFEWQYQRPNREVWDGEVHLMKIKHIGEELLKFSLLDITNRKKAEQALKESEEKYRLLIENQSDLIVKIDKVGRLSFVSKTYCGLYGKSEQELLGKAFLPFVYEDDRLPTESAIKRLHKPPHKLYFRNRAITINGLKWLSWMYTAVLDKNETLKEIIAVGRDITGKVKTENNLIDSEQKLRKLNATKDKFFSIIAHDLRGPFNSMLGFAKLLVDRFDRFDIRKQKEFLGILANNLENTHKLLENLLLWARTQRGTIDFYPQKENLYSLSSETIELLRQSSANKAIFLINQIPEDIYVKADKNMLLTIFRNLISNAIKFTPKEGKIVISAALVTDQDKQKFVEISVKDSGVGIEKEKRAQLFNISENISTKGTEGESGTGLGLILCKEFVEKHGGTIRVESEIWKGSSFIFTLS